MLFLLAHACIHAPGDSMTKQGSFAVHLTAAGTTVSATVENTGSTGATFCTYHTPFEGIRNDIFVVERDGAELPYRGMMAKRAPPGPADHRTLAPGKSVGPATVDLADTYALETGTYTVRFRGNGIAGLPDSNTVQVVVP